MKKAISTTLLGLCMALPSLVQASPWSAYRGEARQEHREERREDRHERREDRFERREDRREDRFERREDRRDHWHTWQDERHNYRHHDARFQRGNRLPVEYRHPRYYVQDWRAYHLYAPPQGYRWVRVNNEILLVSLLDYIIFGRN